MKYEDSSQRCASDPMAIPLVPTAAAVRAPAAITICIKLSRNVSSDVMWRGWQRVRLNLLSRKPQQNKETK